MAEGNILGISRIEPLNSKNYILWSMKVGALIKSKHLYDVIESEEPVIDVKDAESIKIHKKWLEKNDEVYGIIILTLSAELAMTVRGITKAKELWELFKKRYEGIEKQRRTQLKINLARIEKRDSESIEEYLIRAQGIANEILELGTKIDESELIGFIIEGLPKKYSEVTTAISSNHNITYEMMRESLLRFERKYDRFHETETKAFRANESRKIECYNCGKFGHLARHCWNKSKMSQSRNNRNYSFKKNVQGSHLNSNKGFREEGVFSHTDRHYNKGSNTMNKKKREHTCFTDEHAMQSKEYIKNRCEECNNGEITWTLDSACTSHMTYRSDIVLERKPDRVEIATADNDRTMQAHYRGNIPVVSNTEESGKTKIKLTDVLYVPSLRENLMSVPSLVKKGKRVILDNEGATIYEKSSGELVAEGTFDENSFKIKLVVRKEGDDKKESSLQTNESNKELWHRRLGHINYMYLNKMAKENIVRGLENMSGQETKCEICIQGKLTRSPFNHAIEGTTCILERLHVDLCGPMKVQSRGGNRYMLMIVDEFSRRYFVEFVRSKDEVTGRIINVIERRENETGKRVKAIRSDNGSEFTNESLINYYKSKGIKSERTTIHSPQSNGIAERANRTIISTGRTLLIEAKLPLSFWAEAVSTAVYIHNITPTAVRKKTPLEIWTNRKPTVKHMRVFGCKAYYRNDDSNKKKFDVRAKPAVFVGYSKDRRAYRLYDIKEKRIRESREVVFIEEKMGYESEINEEQIINGFEYIDITERKNNVDVQAEHDVDVQEENDFDGYPEKMDQEHETVVLTEHVDNTEFESNTSEITDRKEQKEENNNENVPSDEPRRSTRIRKPNPKYFASLVQEEKVPRNYEDVLNSKNKEKWLEAIKKELDSLEEHKTWKIVDKPKNVKPLQSKWVFTLKENGENIKYKARLVADGSRLKFGVNYQESYSPVMKSESFRTLLAIAAMKNYKTRFFDVETAYLNAELDNAVYMNPPEGLDIKGGKILLVTGNLYGLPEAGRCWYEKLRKIFSKIGLQACKADPCIFINRNDDKFVAVGMYVDDGIIVSESEESINKLIGQIRKEIKIKELKGKIKFLGIEIEEDQEGFLLGQENYITKILERYDMQNCKSVKTPGAIGINLDKHENSKEVDLTLYQEMLGSINYLVTGTRPDLAFTVSKLSQYAKNPKEIHLQAIKRVMRYIQGTKNHKLQIKRNKGQLTIYSDASWCTTPDSKSFGGYVVKIGDSVIGWRSNKQKLVALSTMEAELLSLCNAVCEGKWLINLLEELEQEELVTRPIIINTDSQAVIDWLKNPKINSRNKHIGRKYHFVKDERERGEIETKYINTSELEADMMTKDLSQEITKKHKRSLGLIEFDVTCERRD